MEQLDAMMSNLSKMIIKEEELKDTQLFLNNVVRQDVTFDNIDTKTEINIPIDVTSLMPKLRQDLNVEEMIKYLTEIVRHILTLNPNLDENDIVKILPITRMLNDLQMYTFAELITERFPKLKEFSLKYTTN